MIATSQDIGNFIERQRSKLNKSTNRQQINRQRPAPPPPLPPPPPPPPPTQYLPPPPQYLPPNNLEDRLDFKVARILDEPLPRIQSQQAYFPPSPRPLTSSPFLEQQQLQQEQMSFMPDQDQRRNPNDTGNNDNNNNQSTFFDRFGDHDVKRAQLKDDLKREYNEFLRSQQRGPKSRSTSQMASSRGNTTRRVQFQQNGTVVAPWEKKDGRTIRTTQSLNDIPTPTTAQYPTNRSLSRVSGNDEQYIRDREEYILELYDQIRELEARKRQLEMESSKLPSGNSSSITRAHYTEDLNALNSLLAERLGQRNAVDHELARILNRPPVSSSPTLVSTSNMPSLSRSLEQSYEPPSQRNNQQYSDDRRGQQYRNDNRSRANGDNGFQIGREVDKEAEQAAKKRYQLELQAQMREAQMRKVQAKQEKDEYEKKLEADIKRYNYFGRSGGGAPMRDKDGNVVANLADLRNPPQQQQQQYQSPRSQQQQQYGGFDDKVYSLGAGTSSITNAPFYNGDQQQYPPNTDRSGSPNHTRGAVSNGIFGTVKTEEQIMREERYKQDLKKQIDEKRQRNAEELARRRAEEERELAKHVEWQQQMEKQMADEASRKQEKEVQERQHQQQLQEELERQRKQEEIMMKRKPKRQEKTMSPRNEDDDDDNADRQNTYDEQQQQQESIYRSVSPPVPTLKNKSKKQKSNVQRSSVDETDHQQPPPFFNDNDNDELIQPPIDDNDSQSRQASRKPLTPRQTEIPPARRKPPQTYRSRPGGYSNIGYPNRVNSTISLRSDGSDSEVLNRLEHLKRQLKDKEARLQQHAKAEAAFLSDIEEQTTVAYRPPSQPLFQRKQSPGYSLNTTRVYYQDLPPSTSQNKLLRVLQTEDDDEFKPSYFRDDSILMRGGGGGMTSRDYISPSKRVDLSDGMFVTNIEDAARRRRYGMDPPGFYDRDDPTSMANLELNRIAEQNEHRLKKLRDLEKDDTSLLDSNEVLERFQQKQRLQRRGSQTTLQDDAWLK